MIVVGIDENGKDKTDESKGERIYDLVTQCPSTCDEYSVLLN